MTTPKQIEIIHIAATAIRNTREKYDAQDQRPTCYSCTFAMDKITPKRGAHTACSLSGKPVNIQLAACSLHESVRPRALHPHGKED